VTGRRRDIRGLRDEDVRLVELEDSVRVRYQTDPLFHAQVRAGASVLGALYPDMDYLEAVRAALLVVAAGAAVPSEPAPPPRRLVADLFQDVEGIRRPHSLYCAGRGHHHVTDANGDPQCCCGWDPQGAVPRPVTYGAAVRAVREHLDKN
jgi:hypothetical protein